MSRPDATAYVIAEMACSHEGDQALAKRIIDSAGLSGSDAIQFQIWKAKNIMSPQHKDFPLLQRIEMSYVEWNALYTYVKAHYPTMDVIACIYDLETLHFTEELGVDAYKVHNADLTNPMLVKEVAKTKKRIDLSIGGALHEEITQCLRWIKSVSEADVWLMYGLQNFPTAETDINVHYMQQLAEKYQCSVGYQDHSDPESQAAFWLPAVAYAGGVHIIEKHITHDRSMKGVDHEAALNPDEFIRFVKMIKDLQLSFQALPMDRQLSPSEETYRQYARKSVLFARDLASGHCVGPNDFIFLRTNGMGVSPHQAQQYIGKRLRRKVVEHEMLSEEVIS